MLATGRLASRRSVSSILYTQRIRNIPGNTRWATGGPEGKTQVKEKAKDSDKVVKEYLDSLKATAEPASKSTILLSESNTPNVSPKSPSSSEIPSASSASSASPTASKPQPPLVEQLSSDANRARQSLAIWKDAALSLVRSRAQKASAEAAVQFGELGGKLNKVTGYDEIEALKRRVVEREKAIAALRVAARDAKDVYSAAVTTRAARQREVNDLLQRKSSWSDADVLAFTRLVREDHLSAAAEQQAKLALEQAEAAVDVEFGALMRAILDRYHEEQVWSDKIRSVSTYGSLAALVANMVVFVLAIVLVEPWKRKRLAQTFERRIVEMSEQTREMVEGGMKGLEEHFEKQEGALMRLVEPWRAPEMVPVDHEKAPITDVPEPVESEPMPAIDLSAVERARVWLESLIPATDRDYALMAVGGVGVLAGSGLALLLRR